MDNIRPEGTEDQSVTSTSGEYLGMNVHVRHSERIRKFSQRYDPGFGAAREWKNDDVTSIVYMIQDGYLNSNVNTDDTLYLIAEWDEGDFMDTSSEFHMRESYVLKSQIHNTDTPMCTEALSGENTGEYFEAMDYEIQNIMGRDTWEIFQGIKFMITMCFQEHGI